MLQWMRGKDAGATAMSSGALTSSTSKSGGLSNANTSSTPPSVAPIPSADFLKDGFTTGPAAVERFYGLENALYFCRPFRECVQHYSYPLSAAILVAKSENIVLPNLNEPLASDTKSRTSVSAINSPISTSGSSLTLPFRQQLERLGAEQNEETLLTTMRDLFTKISSQKKRTGVLKPLNFILKLKKENEIFQGTTQQDAQEFLNYLLNAVSEILLRHKKEYTDKLKLLMPDSFPGAQPAKTNETIDSEEEPKKKYAASTWVHELFEGQLTNETKCLTCETTTNRDEAFLDLSVDISQHTSISTCLRNFSTSETLCAKDKFYCDKCKSLQEAEKRMKIKSLPNILAVHLKRFKYVENLQRFIKLNYRVVFPFELKLFNTSDDAEDSDRLYTLSSVIVHLGIGPHQGHYIALVKSFDHWVLFDDDNVECVDETEISRYFGDLNNPGTGYILLYERVGFDAKNIVEGMKTPGSPGTTDFPSASASVTSPPTPTLPPYSIPSLPPYSIRGSTDDNHHHLQLHPLVQVSAAGQQQGGGGLNIAGGRTSSSGGGGFGRMTADGRSISSPNVAASLTSASGGGGFSGLAAKFKRPSTAMGNNAANNAASVDSHEGDFSTGGVGMTVGKDGDSGSTSSWWKRKNAKE
ncbi:hypothetical protein HK100_010924 [Physocladia obscura]|uniref:ubiquitinyl hydrolase 1 n=1 Tax=Physocladia obscura TaxID=109957 RepID=A0AAD5XDL6_9FUNG|nr:hypothetical protein HK100_010924 [Physocladia obscura]